MTTTNPYYECLQHLPAYGRFNPKVPGYLAEVTLDPEEAVISSIKCNHGQGHVGHLAITTTRLRWFQRLLTKGHDHWPLPTTMIIRRGVPTVIEMQTGDLFQSRAASPRLFKDFVGLHQQMVEALRWEIEHTWAEPASASTAGTTFPLSQELDRLSQQVVSGLLTPAEFDAAKRRLLGSAA